MDDWVLVKSIVYPNRLWCIRATKIMTAVGRIGLEVISCETAPIEPMMQEFLNNRFGEHVFLYEL